MANTAENPEQFRKLTELLDEDTSAKTPFTDSLTTQDLAMPPIPTTFENVIPGDMTESTEFTTANNFVDTTSNQNFNTQTTRDNFQNEFTTDPVTNEATNNPVSTAPNPVTNFDNSNSNMGTTNSVSSIDQPTTDSENLTPGILVASDSGNDSPMTPDNFDASNQPGTPNSSNQIDQSSVVNYPTMNNEIVKIDNLPASTLENATNLQTSNPLENQNPSQTRPTQRQPVTQKPKNPTTSQVSTSNFQSAEYQTATGTSSYLNQYYYTTTGGPNDYLTTAGKYVDLLTYPDNSDLAVTDNSESKIQEYSQTVKYPESVTNQPESRRTSSTPQQTQKEISPNSTPQPQSQETNLDGDSSLEIEDEIEAPDYQYNPNTVPNELLKSLEEIYQPSQERQKEYELQFENWKIAMEDWQAQWSKMAEMEFNCQQKAKNEATTESKVESNGPILSGPR